MLRALLAMLLPSHRPTTRHRNRKLGMESFESRHMLTGALPSVVAVEVSSTAWSAGFTDYLQSHSYGENGYAIPTGSSAQTAALPWSNLNQIRIRFSEDVWVDSNDLFLSGVNNATYSFSNFEYDLDAFEAVWTLTNNLSVDSLLIDLAGDGLDPIVDLQGNVLDGEWVNNSSSGESGNGTAGGDFQFAFKVNPGDFNQSGLVNYTDYSGVYGKRFTTTSSPSYTPFADINGSGAVDTSDLNLVYANFNRSVPTADPAGVNNDGPTASPIPPQEIWNDIVNVSVPLFPHFDDAEDSDSSLVLAVQANSNAALFDSISINTSTGNLVLNTAASVSGRAFITVSATDTDGFVTKQDVIVDVDRTNSPPFIDSVNVSDGEIPGTWEIEGFVIDTDDNGLRKREVVLSNLVNVRIKIEESPGDGPTVGRFFDVVPSAGLGEIDFYVEDPSGDSDETTLEIF
jgi:hypothetical protein